jgi:hypothetical protein
MTEKWAFFILGILAGSIVTGLIVRAGARRAIDEIKRIHLAVLAENSVLRRSLDAFTK